MKGKGMSRFSGSEIVAVTGGLAALAAVTFGANVVHGHFVSDDWYSVEAGVHHSGFFAIAAAITRYFGRPAQARVFAVPVVLFGQAPAGYFVWTLLLALLSAVLLFLLARTFGLSAWQSAVIGALFLLLPATNTDRMWAATAPANLAVAFFFGGLLLARRGFLSRGRAAVAWHIAAVILYVSSILIYEIAAPAILLTFLPYSYWAGRRAAIRRWRWDVLFALGALAVVAYYSTHAQSQSVATALRDKVAIAEGTVEVLARSVLPIGASTGVTLGIAALAILAGLLGWRKADPITRNRAKPYLKMAALAVGTIAIGYGTLIGTADRYRPTGLGLGGNRINVLSAAGYALFVYAAARLLGLLIGRGQLGRARWLTALAVAAILVGYVMRDRADVHRWDRMSDPGPVIAAGMDDP
jgi:hypothetical protein